MWWCNNCKREMEGFNVTYEEHCYICGHPIMSLDVEYSNEDIERFINIGIALDTLFKNENVSELIMSPYGYIESADELLEYFNKL